MISRHFGVGSTLDHVEVAKGVPNIFIGCVIIGNINLIHELSYMNNSEVMYCS